MEEWRQRKGAEVHDDDEESDDILDETDDDDDDCSSIASDDSLLTEIEDEDLNHVVDDDLGVENVLVDDEFDSHDEEEEAFGSDFEEADETKSKGAKGGAKLAPKVSVAVRATTDNLKKSLATRTNEAKISKQKKTESETKSRKNVVMVENRLLIAKMMRDLVASRMSFLLAFDWLLFVFHMMTNSVLIRVCLLT